MKIKCALLIASLFLHQSSIFAQSVGTIEGSFDVSDIGAASYSIPIKIPPGIHGLQPDLSVNYSSHVNLEIRALRLQP